MSLLAASPLILLECGVLNKTGLDGTQGKMPVLDNLPEWQLYQKRADSVRKSMHMNTRGQSMAAAAAEAIMVCGIKTSEHIVLEVSACICVYSICYVSGLPQRVMHFHDGATYRTHS